MNWIAALNVVIKNASSSSRVEQWEDEYEFASELKWKLSMKSQIDMKQFIFERIRMNAMRGMSVSLVIIIDDSSPPLLLSTELVRCFFFDFEIDERIVSSLVTNSTLDFIHSNFSKGLLRRERRLNSRRTDWVLMWKYFESMWKKREHKTIVSLLRSVSL